MQERVQDWEAEGRDKGQWHQKNEENGWDGYKDEENGNENGRKIVGMKAASSYSINLI